MPSLLLGKQVTLSETDSEGGKNYVQHTYGPEEDMKLNNKFVSSESDKSVCQPVSKEVRDRYIADSSLENISVGSSTTADMLGITSLSPTHSQTRKQFDPLNETNSVPSLPDTHSSAPHTNATIQDTHTNAPDVTTSFPAGNSIAPIATTGGLDLHSTAPHTSSINQGTNSIVPDTHTIVPDAHSIGPVTHTNAPVTHTIVPDAHTNAPVTHTIVPDAHTIGPVTHTIGPNAHTIGSDANPIADSGYPDIVNSNPTKPDVISHVIHLPEPTLDGPAILGDRDFIVNSITGTIHSFNPEISNVSSMETTNSNASIALPGYSYPDSYPQDPSNASVNSDVSISPISVTSPQQKAQDLDSIKTESEQNNVSSLSEINVEEGLGPNYMYRQINMPHSTDSFPSLSPSDKTVYLSGGSENEFKSIKSEYTSMPDTQSGDSISPLSLYEDGATLDPNIDYTQLLHDTASPDKQQQQQQQQINLDTNTDFSMIMQNTLQQDTTGQDKEMTPISSLQPVSLLINK